MTKHILFRVYVVWFFRRIVPLMALEVVAAAAFLKLFARAVFVERVLENAATGRVSLWGIVAYFFKAYLRTELVVQAAILLVLGLGALVLRDVGRALFIWLRTARTRVDPLIKSEDDRKIESEDDGGTAGFSGQARE